MAPRQLYGRTSRAPTAPRQSDQGRPTQSQVAVPWPQTAPSVQPGPRFKPPQITAPAPWQAPNQSPTWREGDNTNDQLIHRSRHPWFFRGRVVAGRISSMHDPQLDGPARPALHLRNVTWNWQVGTGSAYADDLTRNYSGLGEQGSGWSSIYGGTPGFYREGPGGMPIGDPSQGPGRVFAGPPHGLHTDYAPDRIQTQAGYRARPQMRAARVDRLSNSRIAGQNYSQWTEQQGGGGTG